MANSDDKATIGFLSIREHDELGAYGGYLVLNAAGRPMEFHCTAPVRANRAQEILYGNSLKPYLYGDQISRTLVEKAKTKPTFICTDTEPALAVRPHTSAPVVLLNESSSKGDASSTQSYHRFDMAGNDAIVYSTHAKDENAVQQSLSEAFASFDFSEPFSRIHEALDEAQKCNRS